MWSVIICFMQILFMAGGSLIKPGYDLFARNKFPHKNVCVQIRPNGLYNHEPYYLCNSLEIPARPPLLPNWSQQQVVRPFDAAKAREINFQVGSPHQQNSQFLQSAENHPVDISPQHLYYPRHSMPSYSNTYSDTPPAQAEYSPAPANLGSRNTNFLYPTETIPICGNKFARSQEIDQPNNEHLNDQQQITAEAVKHKVNPEGFNNLLDNEVLGTPNLAFSNDELLPNHNMPPVANPAMPFPLQGPHIPREYFDDPVLRTFYNLDQSPVGNIEEPYFLPSTPEYNPVLQASSPLVADNMARSSYPSMKRYRPSIESLIPNKCINNPSKIPPIYITIPWLTRTQLDLLNSMQPPRTCRNGHNCFYNYARNNFNSHRSQFRDNNNNNWSLEDFSNKNSSLTLIQPSLLQSPHSTTTNIPPSTEEDLFVEDTTPQADKANTKDDFKFSENTQGNRDAINFSTTRVPPPHPLPPHTTVSPFKTMINAAKMHTMGLHPNSNPTQQVQNKREVSHVDSSADHSTTVKKEYVMKLEKNYD